MFISAYEFDADGNPVQLGGGYYVNEKNAIVKKEKNSKGAEVEVPLIAAWSINVKGYNFICKTDYGTITAVEQSLFGSGGILENPQVQKWGAEILLSPQALPFPLLRLLRP